MLTLLQHGQKTGDSRCGLRTNEWLRAKRRWQMAEFQEPL